MPRSVRIGYLNPFQEKAENQALASLSEAARRLGHEMIGLAHAGDILKVRPDFVISVATSQPKLTEVPTFGAIHEPRVRLCAEESLFRNTLSYDGCLTISDSLVEFLSALNAGYGRPEEVGFYYNTPQITDIETDLPAVVAAGQLQLCYFGTNWDRRARPLLRSLALKPYTRIHGPEEAWSYLVGSPSFKGPTAFDGKSVQQTYARHGVGLVLLSREHRLEDVISNRIFEIASVGAVAVCPDTPWIKANFGNSVSYYSSDRPVSFNAAEIDRIMADVRADPAAAAERACEARRIFEARFAAERMVESAIRYFDGWSAQAPPAPPAAPVDVVLRLNGADHRKTIVSLQSQTVGQIRLIIAGQDAQTAAGDAVGRAVVEAVAAAGDSSHDRLIAGLALVANPQFAVIEAGDEWLPNRLAEAVRTLERAPRDALMFSRVIQAGDGPEEAQGRSLRPWPKPETSLVSNLNQLGLEGLLGSTAVLKRTDLTALAEGPHEDAVLVGLLLQQGEPVCGHRPTSLARRSPDAADDAAAFLRLGPKASLTESRLRDAFTAYWPGLHDAVHAEMAVKEQADAGEDEANAIEGGSPVPSIHDRSDLEIKQVMLQQGNLWGQPGTEMAEGEDAIDIVMPAPYAYCASINMRDELFEGMQWLIGEFAEITVPFRVGLVNRTTEEMIELDEVPALKRHMEVWLRIEHPAPASYIVMCGNAPSDTKLKLNSLWVARYKTAPEV